MDKRFWGFLVALAIVFVGIFILFGGNTANAPNVSKGTLTNHVRGSGSTGVKVVEYGDFQCPACAQFHPVVEQVYTKYKDQITFQFLNYPLFQIHPNAISSARAAEAADLQGKYWEMFNVLYQNQSAWSSTTNPEGTFNSYAKELGLNTVKFTSDYKSRLVNDRVQADLAEGNKLKITGTPTFFVDGKKIDNPDATLEAFSKVFDAAIKSKTGKAPTATTATPAPASETPAQ